jgi:hypothetical protein
MKSWPVATVSMLLAAAWGAIAAAQMPDLEPKVQTSTSEAPGAAAPGVAAPGAAAPTPAPRRARPAGVAPLGAGDAVPASVPPAIPAAPKPGAKTVDRIELDTTQISGNRELPKVMYVVPWRRADIGEFAGRPPNSLLDEALTPVDRDVFRRQNRYYAALEAGAAAPGAAAPKSQLEGLGGTAASPEAKDEK